MIISQISERTTLSNDVLSSLFAVMAFNCANLFQMLLCLVHICQTQETFDEFPYRGFKYLTRAKGIDTAILSVLQKYNAQRFLHPFLVALAKHSSKPGNAAVLNTILKEERLPSAVVYGVCSSLLNRYLEECKKNETVEINEHVLSILQVLHQNYSKDLDTALQKRLEEAKGEQDTKTHTHLYTFISKVFHGTCHQPLEESNTTLFLSVNHAEASIRLLAIKKLDEILNDKSSELALANNEDTFVKDALLARLQDDDERIAQMVLKMEGLKRFVQPQELLKGLTNVVVTPSTTRATRRHCLIYLLTVFLADNKDMREQVLAIVVGQLLLVKDFHIVSVALISKIPLSELKKESMLKNLSGVIKDLAEDTFANVETLVAANSILIKTLAANVVSHNNLMHGLGVYLEGLKSDNTGFRLLSIFVITKVVHQLGSEQQIKVVSMYLPALLRLLRSHSNSIKTLAAETHDGLPSKELLTQTVTNSWTPSTEVAAIRFSLLSMVSDLKRPPKLAVSWLSSEPLGEYANIILSMYKLFIGKHKIGPYEKMVEKLFEIHLVSDSIEFLCNLWTDPKVPALVRLRSLQIACANLQAFAKQSTSGAVDMQIVIPTLLIALSSPIKAMRETAVVCLESIAWIYPKVKISGKKGKSTATDIFKFDSFYGKTSDQLEFLIPEQISSFLMELLKSREEFVTDGGYLEKYLAKTLNHAANEAKSAAATKESIVSFMLSHVLAFERTSARVELLQLLDNITSPTKLKMLLPLIESLVQSSFVGQNAEEVNVDFARLLVHCFSPQTSSLLEGKTTKYRNAFLQLLKLDNTAASNTDLEESSSSFRRLALTRISGQFFAGLSILLRRDIFVVLIDLATNAPQETVRVVKRVLREIPINSDLVIHELASIQSCLMQEVGVDEENGPKRQRKSSPDPSTPDATVEALHRLVSVLELLEYKDVEETSKLVTPLFELFSTIMNADLHNTPVSIEYVNQLMLSSLTSFIREAESGANAGKLNESILRVDLVVSCIRATGNPQTHNQALLLMAAIASLYPEKVLHNIMPVFTFMGANVLRQDDNYSFHVIQQTLEKIIPPLVTAHRRHCAEGQSLVMQVRPIIKVFVDAIFHIPKHRRLRLFSILISTLGEDDFLHAVTCLIIEKYTERASKGHQTEADSLNEFALSLSTLFSAVVQMKSVIALLDVIQALPNEKPAEGEDVEMEEHLFDLKYALCF